MTLVIPAIGTLDYRKSTLARGSRWYRKSTLARGSRWTANGVRNGLLAHLSDHSHNYDPEVNSGACMVDMYPYFCPFGSHSFPGPQVCSIALEAYSVNRCGVVVDL